MSNGLVISISHGLTRMGAGATLPALFVPSARAVERFFDFFTATIRNKHTRRGYYKGHVSVLAMVRKQATGRTGDTFARIGAVLQMNVGDYFTQGGVAGRASTKRAERNIKRVAITSCKS